MLRLSPNSFSKEHQLHLTRLQDLARASSWTQQRSGWKKRQIAKLTQISFSEHSRATSLWWFCLSLPHKVLDVKEHFHYFFFLCVCVCSQRIRSSSRFLHGWRTSQVPAHSGSQGAVLESCSMTLTMWSWFWGDQVRGQLRCSCMWGFRKEWHCSHSPCPETDIYPYIALNT